MAYWVMVMKVGEMQKVVVEGLRLVDVHKMVVLCG